MRGFVEVFPFAEKCGDTPGFYGKLPGFPVHFSRSGREHSFLWLCLICNPLFGDVKEGRGSFKKEGAAGSPNSSGEDHSSFGFHGQEGLRRDQESLLESRFFSPCAAERVQLLRFGAELAFPVLFWWPTFLPGGF